MLGKVLMWGALLDGALKGLIPLPVEAPEAISILWCPKCKSWRPHNGEEEKNYPVCSGGYGATHHKPATMRCNVYTSRGAMPGVRNDASNGNVSPVGV